MTAPKTLALAGALVLSAVLGGTLMSVAAAAGIASSDASSVRAAATSTPNPPKTAAAAAPTTAPAAAGPGAAYCATFRAAFAAELGVTDAQVAAAARAAAASTVDAAVKAGDLTQAAADRLKTRLATADADACKLVAGWRAKLAKAGLGVVRDALTAAADALGMTPADLRAQLTSGTDLKTIATSKGVDVKTVEASVIAAVKADLDAAVKAGTIKQARADAVLSRLTARLAQGRLRP